jgi:hypothetical protein
MEYYNNERTHSILNIPHFSGHNADFPDWLDRVRFIAMAFEEVPGAISFSFFSLEEWQRLEYAGYTPAIPGNPDNEEAQDEILAREFVDFARPAPNAAVNSVAASNYFTMRTKRAQFLPAFIATLPPEVVQTICADGISLYRAPLTLIVRRLRENYGELKDSDLSKLYLQLDQAFIPSEHKIESFIAKHRSVYYTLAASGFFTHDSEKVNRLVRALTPCKVYNGAIDNYRANHQNALANRFDTFVTFIKAYKLSIETAASEGYASGANKTSTKSTEQTKKKPFSSNKYCWTHGACNHTSARCRTPLIGHEPDATFGQRMGGSNTNCKN